MIFILLVFWINLFQIVMAVMKQGRLSVGAQKILQNHTVVVTCVQGMFYLFISDTVLSPEFKGTEICPN